MADIKTHLRELSVATTVGLLKSQTAFSITDLYDSKKFFAFASRVIDSDISSASNILDVAVYTGELKSIIDNGVKLGRYIFNHSEFNICVDDKIKWTGNDTQKGDPVDLYIGKYGFSLKEESFILRNMGLYELLNCMTGANYQRGLHVFSTFALQEYDAWFAYTWKSFVDYLKKQPWRLTKGKDTSEAVFSGTTVTLKFNNESSTVGEGIKTNQEFMKATSSRTREKVFSKWINTVFSNDSEYLRLKKHCAEVAGAKVSELIVSKYTPKNVYRFFQIYPFEYYYCKTTATETTVLKVPSYQTFSQTVQLTGCRYDVPASQLNIISTFTNTTTGNTLEFRNECRFSHGQFNGTPEAKMYVVRDTPLTALYEPI